MEEEIKNKKKEKYKDIFKEILFLILWVGLIIKLVFDWDILLLQKIAPNYLWIIKYKPLILVIIIILTSKKDVTSIILNILFFLLFIPYEILIHLPYKVFKISKSNGLISYINILIMSLSKFRYKICIFILSILSIHFTINSNNIYLLWFSIVFYTFLILSNLKLIYKSIRGNNNNLFNAYKKIIDFVNKSSSKDIDINNINIKEFNKLEKTDEKVTKVFGVVLLNRITLFISKKYKEYNNQKNYFYQDFIIWIFTLILLVFCLALIFYTLYKINPSYYIIKDNITFIDFILFCLGLTSSVEGNITFIKALTIILAIGRTLYPALLIPSFISANKKQQQKNINKVIDSFEKIADNQEQRLVKTKTFSDINQVIDSLHTIHKEGLNVIDYFTSKIN